MSSDPSAASDQTLAIASDRLDTAMPSKVEKTRAETRWLMALKRQAGRGYLLALLAPVISGGLLVIQAFTFASVLERAIVGGVAPTALLPGIALIAGLILVRTILGALGDRSSMVAAERIKLNLRTTLFGSILAKPPSWSDGRSSGALSSVMVEQVEAVDGFFSRYYPAMVQASVLPIAFAAIILPLDWLAALLFLVTAPLIPVFMALVGWGAQAATEHQATALSRLSGRFADRLRGLTTLRLFGRATSETEAVYKASENLRERTLKVLRIAFLSSAVLEFFAALGVAGVALYVGLSFLGLINVRGTPLPYQVGLFVLLMAPEVYQPLRVLAAHYHDRAAAKAAVGEMLTQFGGLPQIDQSLPDRASTIAAKTGPAALEIRGVIVQTPDRGRTILDRLDLSVPAGQSVAILGASGIGKSTLLEAIGRLRPYDGEIRLDGADLANIDEAQLRTELAFLPQRPRMFYGTIAENIRLGRQAASDAEVNRAANLAGVDDFAARLPLGLDTPLGDGGLGLSGGEIQRVALARIFLRDPRVMLLDEPTAHLDAATQRQVLDSLMRFAAGRTLIIATHSAAVVSRMEKVWRMAGGKLLPTPFGRRALPPQSLRGAA
jgi:ATP-binding cassette subfamily C protein CydD